MNLYKMIMVIFIFVNTSSLMAEVYVANIFNNNMVLPRRIEIPIWGTADPGTKITVSFSDSVKNTESDIKGEWVVYLDRQEAKSIPNDLIIKNNDTGTTTVFKNILVGEVWLGSGQSNMAATAGKEAAKDNTPEVRIGTVPSTVFDGKDDFSKRALWRTGETKSAPGCSGTALYFARKLQAELKIPVGVIVSAVGGSRIEAWLNPKAMDKNLPDCKYRQQILSTLKKYKDRPTNPSDKPAYHVVGTREWADARLGGRYKGMILPLSRFPVSGFLWYQGENNIRHHQEYKKLLPALIEDWREKWKKDLPFLIVQLPSYHGGRKPEGVDWAEMREVQFQVASEVNNCDIVVTFDNDDPNELHPKNKPTVGVRLANMALNMVYGYKEIVAKGPLVESVTFNKSEIIINFINCQEGLFSKNGDELKGFQIAGENKIFSKASARISGKSIIVSSKTIVNPIAVRYAWVNVPVVDLTNKDGIPAAPFRTDSW